MMIPKLKTAFVAGLALAGISVMDAAAAMPAAPIQQALTTSSETAAVQQARYFYFVHRYYYYHPHYYYRPHHYYGYHRFYRRRFFYY